MPTHNSTRNIQRIDPPKGGFGGYWRVKVSRPGMRYDQRFADTSYETAEHAQIAAQAFLRRLLERLPGERQLRADGDGLPGTIRRKERPTPMWTAQLTLGENKFNKSFSISRHGDVAARRLAFKERQRWLKQLGIEHAPSLPTQEEVEELAKQVRKEHNERPGIKEARTGFNEEQRYGLTRREADEKEKNGYWVVVIRRNGLTYRKQFGDGAYGGAERAFAAAREYRDQILLTFPAMSKRARQEIVTKRNSSGHAGVFPVRKDGAQIGWGAQLIWQGKIQRQLFSIKKWGIERAFELALQARKGMLESVQGNWTLSPAAKKPKNQPLPIHPQPRQAATKVALEEACTPPLE